ncbi:hypothetical protein [Azotobacter vinelandii]|uniref:hypothetical protein n=1 Tax=Azotobacter vinelandii TaxID=354 RepID=UPI002665AE3D|nr:hypothetical protein [Azotobacter vinelandii]WKN21505.1 hypothetical protein AVAEIV_004605 [Azotobacter vinelandii]
MTKFARVIDDVALELWSDDGRGISVSAVFVPELAAQFMPVPDDVRPGWMRVNGAWTAPDATDPLAPDYGTLVTVLAFRQRFSLAERQAIEMGSLDDPNGTAEERALAAALRVYQTDLAAATFVDLGATETRASVQQLAAFGLLADGRVEEILDTPVRWEELPVDRQASA